VAGVSVRLPAWLDPFLAGLALMLGLAWVWPSLGQSGGVLRLDLVTAYGVALVFLLHGLLLAPERLRAGLLNWRLHVFIQGASFLLFPLLIWGVLIVLGERVGPETRLGFLFLAALPTAVSSSVVVTAVAGGNVAGAVFNAALSSLLGVILTPLWVNLYLSTDGGGLDLATVLLRLMLLVVLPLVVGQILRPWFGRLAAGAAGLDRLIVLLVVQNAFSDSFSAGLGHGAGSVAAVGLSTGALFLFMAGLLAMIGRAVGMPRADILAGTFCGAQKSLATGAPMAGVMFAADPDLGALLLPVILYQLIQLAAGGALARRLGRTADGA
jgi:sodium/bile acid cotransporter 7